MQITDRIRDFFETYSGTIFDADGNAVPTDQLISEYSAIKSNLMRRAQPEDVVGILLPYNYRYLLCILAAMETGRVFVPMRLTWPASRIAQVAQITRYQLLIDERAIESFCKWQGSPSVETFVPRSDMPLYIMCTSGSTGTPKAVIVGRSAYEAFFVALVQFVAGISVEDHLLFVTDFTFDVSLMDVALLIHFRMKFYFSQFGGNIFRLGHEIEKYGITCLTTVPNNIRMLLREEMNERFDFSRLKRLFVGGANFPIDSYRKVFEKFMNGVELYNFYGPTEATIFCHASRLKGFEHSEVEGQFVTIGKPFPDVECKLISPSGVTVTTPLERGEMVLAGAQLMQGYCGSIDDWWIDISGTHFYRTGDTAFFDQLGNYYIAGRLDETLKRRGYRINLLDIDAYIRRLVCVQDAVTIACPDMDIENILVTFIVLRRAQSLKDLRTELASQLVSYQMPDHIYFVEDFPLNDAGKVDRRVLLELFRCRACDGIVNQFQAGTEIA